MIILTGMFRRLACTAIFSLWLTILVTAQQPTLPKLQLSANQRYLVTADGKPFLWMADTAWELFHRLTREEALHYLDKRAEQGFNVVQAVALAELDGLHTPNAYGHTPLTSVRPLAVDEAYFAHVDYLVKEAGLRGIYVALLPTWGDKLFRSSWGVGPEIFDAALAYEFGHWIGSRYRHQSHIIWVIGGDRNPRSDADDVTVWRQMAEGIAAGCGGHEHTLMTFHPQPAQPGGSSNWFHHDEWLDFNMHQTGHCPDQPTYRKISHDYNLVPVKPVLDGEPLYEDHPNCFRAHELGHSIPEDIRRIMYWNVFAGAFGQTYGCHAVWQMYDQGRDPINAPLRPWHVAVDLPMAWQVQHLKNLMLSRPFLTRIPAADMVVTQQQDDESYVIATRDSSGSYAMVYFPTGKTVDLDLSAMSSAALNATWYDLRTGAAFPAGRWLRSSVVEAVPPTSGKGHDWVLVIDDSRAGFGAPGLPMH